MNPRGDLKMKILLTFVSCLILMGCRNPVAQVGEAAVKENHANWELLGPRQLKYIEKDERLKPKDKEDRIKAVKEAMGLATRMKEAYKK
jgi:hypothetical protein